MGQVIGMFLRETPKERPLTHDLIANILKGFSISVERVVITELKNSTYYARLILHQQNELARKIVEIDARPSDCLAIATAQKRPIFVSSKLFDQVEDTREEAPLCVRPADIDDRCVRQFLRENIKNQGARILVEVINRFVEQYPARLVQQ